MITNGNDLPVCSGGKNLSDELVARGLAKQYFGDKK